MYCTLPCNPPQMRKPNEKLQPFVRHQYIYYWVRSQLTRRRRYYMYNALDSIEETSREKQQRENSPRVQGPPVEH